MNSDGVPRRIFIPFQVPYYAQIAEHKPLEAVTYNADKGFFQLQGSVLAASLVPRLDNQSLVVYIAVASGTGPGSAGYSLYFGPGSLHNATGKIEPSLARDNNRAHIAALKEGIDHVNKILENNFFVSNVKFATDSEYLVSAVGEDMEELRESDGNDDEGNPVPYFDVLSALLAQLDEMEYGGDYGILSQLWLVSEGENISDARRLAEQPL